MSSDNCFKGSTLNVSPLCQCCELIYFAAQNGIRFHECEICKNEYQNMVNDEKINQMEEKISVEFTGKEFDKIMEYMKCSEATTIQNAILNAISIALDDGDDHVSMEWNPDCEGCNPEDPGECQLCRER